MALRFIEGFDHCTSLATLQQKWTNVLQYTASVPMSFITGRRANSKALLISNDNDYLALTLDHQQTWIVGLALYLYGNEDDTLLSFCSDTDVQTRVMITGSGAIRLMRGGAVLALSDKTLPVKS